MSRVVPKQMHGTMMVQPNEVEE